jgi:hypothetical protein
VCGVCVFRNVREARTLAVLFQGGNVRSIAFNMYIVMLLWLLFSCSG